MIKDSNAMGATGRSEPPTAAEERLAAILEHTADAIVVADEWGLIEDCNLAAAQLFGWARDELCGQRLEALMGGADQEHHQAHIQRYLTTGRSGILNIGPRTLQARRRDGQTVPIELSVGEARIAGRRKFIGACRDISQRLANEAVLAATVADPNRTVAELHASGAALEHERRQCEAWARTAEAAQLEAEAANLAKSRFLATMSHEIRTPLNGVIAIADVLRERLAAVEERDLVDIIRQSGRTLLSLLNEILDLAKIEAGAFSLAAAPFWPYALIESLATSWRSAASAKGLSLQVRTAELPMVVGDEDRLRQVINNLISNAIKFTDRGSVSIDCRCVAIEPGRATLELSVVDTGQGFDADFAERMFKPFVQADSTNTRQHGGTGLGLAICRELVGLMGGEIRAEGAPGAGARIVVRLALPVAIDEAAPAEPGHRPMAPMVAAVGLKVLVAEDHPLNQRIMGILLNEFGVAYEVVEDGAAAVEAVATGRFDLVLMDVQMPRLDGLEATRAIRRLPGAPARIPVIAITAYVMSDHAEACRSAGMDDFLAKPIEPQALQRILDHHLRVAESRRIAS